MPPSSPAPRAPAGEAAPRASVLGALRARTRRFLAPDPPAPPCADPDEARRRLRRWQLSALASITLGYGFFYTTRLSLSVAKGPLLDERVASAEELGQLGFAMLLAYAAGRFTNGLLADRVNLRRFFATGLLASSLANLGFGLSGSFGAFLFFWTLNGWVQSLGSPTCGVVMAHWFERDRRGTVYSVWSLAHNLGEGLSFAVTAALVGAAGWRAGFLAPAALCLVVALVLYRTGVDRPEAKGLPGLAERAGAPPPADAPPTVAALQREVLRNPWIWALGLASALMYVVRYAVNHWGILFLQLEKGYSLERAGLVVSLFPLVGIAGTLLAGLTSDRLFGGRRAPATTLYGLLLVASLAALCFAPASEAWLPSVALSTAGFAIGGLLVFLGGLAALDLSSPRAAGAAMGFVGGLSYAGAAAQDWVSGSLLEASRRVAATGEVRYDFTAVKLFWLSAAVLSLVLGTTLWLAERRTARRRRAGP